MIRRLTQPISIAVLLWAGQLTYGQNWYYGSYVGTGSSFSRTGMPFQPAAVIIKANAATSAYIKISTMASNVSKAFMSTSTVTDAITAINADGFTVGTNAEVNTSGTTYYWVALKATSSVKTGTYTGNGAASRNINAFAGQGKFNIIIPETVDQGSIYYTSDGTDEGRITGTSSTYSSPAGTAPPANGFEVFSGNATNVNTVVYHYISFLDVAGTSKISGFTADGTDNRNITGVGFQPALLFVCNAGNGFTHMRSAANAGDDTQVLSSSANATNLIQSFAADGFQVGSGTTNSKLLGVGYTVTYMAMGSGSVLPIDLLSFNAMNECSRNIISWETADESNNDFFTIERSTDGNVFEPIGTVKGAGNSSAPLDYQFTDPDFPGARLVYYRLRQTDFNGQSKTFTPVSVNGCEQEQSCLSIYPSLVAGSEVPEVAMTVRDMEEKELEIEVRSTMGELVFRNRIAPNSDQYNSRLGMNQRLPAGVYYITGTDGRHTCRAKMIVH